MQSSAIFLDRDGVINHNYGYVYKQENFDFIEGVFDLTLRAQKLKYKLIIITNQSGIARGYYTEEHFHCLTAWMCDQFSAAGSTIDHVYYSPYHPTAGIGKYLKDDYSRKPNPGMILQAQKDFSIDLGSSILIGDKVSDMQAGIAAGVGINLLFSEERPSELNGMKYELITNLQEAIPYLMQDIK